MTFNAGTNTLFLGGVSPPPLRSLSRAASCPASAPSSARSAATTHGPFDSPPLGPGSFTSVPRGTVVTSPVVLAQPLQSAAAAVERTGLHRAFVARVLPGTVMVPESSALAAPATLLERRRSAALVARRRVVAVACAAAGEKRDAATMTAGECAGAQSLSAMLPQDFCRSVVDETVGLAATLGAARGAFFADWEAQQSQLLSELLEQHRSVLLLMSPLSVAVATLSDGAFGSDDGCAESAAADAERWAPKLAACFADTIAASCAMRTGSSSGKAPARGAITGFAAEAFGEVLRREFATVEGAVCAMALLRRATGATAAAPGLVFPSLLTDRAFSIASTPLSTTARAALASSQSESAALSLSESEGTASLSSHSTTTGAGASPTFALSGANMRRALLAALRLAAKMHETRYFTLRDMASAMGLPSTDAALSLHATCEWKLAAALGFDALVSEQEFQATMTLVDSF